MGKGTIVLLLFILGAIPLLAYPGVLIAHVMLLAAAPGSEEKFSFKLAIIYAFVFVSTSYLLTYIVCLVYYFIRGDQSILLSAIPLLHLSLALLLLLLWRVLE